MRRIIAIPMIILMLGATVPSIAQDVSEPFGSGGSINWTDQVVRATGIAVQGGVGGRAGQIRAAELDALRQILETVKGMRLSSETVVENYMLSSDMVRTRVEGVARNFQRVGDPVYMSDGSIEVTVEMTLTGPGRLLDVVMPVATGGARPVYNQPPPAWQPYTGLIVDARGLGLRPALSPKIYDEEGNVIYGERYVSRDWVIQHGMVGYAKDIEAAIADDRVSPSPYVVKAERATGENRTDVVISDKDAQVLHGVADNYAFLTKCRVIFLVD